MANRRSTTRDVEIEGRKIAPDEKLSLNWISANRDGRTFDDPDAVRLDRDPANNLLFGAGIHYCPGAPLARLEMRVALEELFARTTMIELGADDLPRRAYLPEQRFWGSYRSASADCLAISVRATVSYRAFLSHPRTEHAWWRARIIACGVGDSRRLAKVAALIIGWW